MGRLWDLIEQHRDAQQYPPSYRALARRLDVSPSLFDTWKAPKRLPSRENLEAVARMVGVAYQTVLDAALDDTRYRIPPSRDAEAGEEHADRSAPMNPAGESPADDSPEGEVVTMKSRRRTSGIPLGAVADKAPNWRQEADERMETP